MTGETNENLFGVIAANLADLRAQVEGESGAKIRAIGDATGTLPDLVRQVVNTITEVLEWLYKISVAAEQQLISADAAIAALEILADSIEALGEGLAFGDMPEALGLPSDPFEKVGEAVGSGHEVLATGLEIANLLPRPENLRAIRRELELQLGVRVNPLFEPPGPGALGLLVEDITVNETV